MKLTPFQIALYIIFIICILLISYYYTNQYTHTNETFTDDDLKTSLTAELNRLKITDIGIQSRVIENMIKFSQLLDTYKILQVPITINNNGVICDQWGAYENSKYDNQNNNCIKINGDNKCLSRNSIVSCSNYYSDTIIDEYSKINTESLLNDIKYQLFTEINGINAELNEKTSTINKLLEELIIQKNLEIQQKYFIEYNTKNLEDKKKLTNKNNLEFETSENNVNINKIQLKQNEKINQTSTIKASTYYTIIIYIIVLLIIVGLINFSLTEIL
jgi:hypothetical protein